ncbi:hypothetical protein [Cohnella algarum]|uniref:hypothetical protein n=1 Tax=Cohnella algarum TaxID=2044859 RepID=UPI0019675D8F|nr:hypothetical protein [Cohnella algarum]MBN2984653.1 hypothetical protein [Cohnella algarum]
MIFIVLVYGAIFWVEWGYLKKHTRKKRTKGIVFGVFAFSFVYVTFVYYGDKTNSIPYIYPTLLPIFEPVMKWMSGN